VGRNFTSGRGFTTGQPKAQIAELDLEWENTGEKRRSYERGRGGKKQQPV